MVLRKGSVLNTLNNISIFTTLYFIFIFKLFAGTENTNDYSQKAKIIKYIISTTSWPADSILENSINICVMGHLNHMGRIKALQGTTINQHNIVVKEISNTINVKNNCQLIYIDNPAEIDTKKIIDAFANQPVLLLADSENFANQGGTMSFVSINNTLGLTINTESLKKSKLQMDRNAYERITIIPEKRDLSD